MVNSNILPRLSNVIRINNAEFGNAFNRQIKFEQIDFSTAGIFKSSPGSIIDWLNSGKTNTSESWEVTAEKWYRGMTTYDKEIDLSQLVANGAKYLYILGNYFVHRSSGAVVLSTTSLFAYKKNGSVYSKGTNINIAQYDFIISDIAVDEERALNSGYDAHIGEMLFPIDQLIELSGGTKAYVGYISESPESVTGVSCDYQNTEISEPIVYVIY